MTHRLFIALRPPEQIRNALLDVMEGVEDARWQGDELLHVTLRFAGELETPGANDLAAALGKVRAPGFDLRVQGTGTFERKGRPTSLWARVPLVEPLEALRQKVEHACEAVGLPRETRRFTPHITLARLGRSARLDTWLPFHADLRTTSWTVKQFLLFESHLGSGGAHYEAVASYALHADGHASCADNNCR